MSKNNMLLILSYYGCIIIYAAVAAVAVAPVSHVTPGQICSFWKTFISGAQGPITLTRDHNNAHPIMKTHCFLFSTGSNVLCVSDCCSRIKRRETAVSQETRWLSRAGKSNKTKSQKDDIRCLMSDHQLLLKTLRSRVAVISGHNLNKAFLNWAGCSSVTFVMESSVGQDSPVDSVLIGRSWERVTGIPLSKVTSP